MISGPLIDLKIHSKKGFTPNKFTFDDHVMQELPNDVRGNRMMTKRPSYVLPTPQGFFGAKNVLENRCLFTTMVMSSAMYSQRQRILHHKKCVAVNLICQHIQNASKTLLSARAGKYVLKEVKRLEAEFSKIESVEEIVNSYALNHQIQIIVYNDKGELAGKFPMELKIEWPFAFLLLTRDGNKSHLEIIRNLEAFCIKVGFQCFFPGCGFKSRYFRLRRHLCKTTMPGVSSCFNCRKVTTSLKLQMEAGIKSFLFCSNKKLTESIACQDCNLTMTNQKCFFDHSSICKRIGFLCTRCNTYVPGDQKLGKMSHVCGKKVCLNCFQPLEEDIERPRSEHLCSWSKVKLRTELPNVSFAQFQMSAPGNASCTECFKMEQLALDERCIYHKHLNDDCKVWACSLIHEQEIHEKWQSVFFVDPSLKCLQPAVPVDLPQYIPSEIKKDHLQNLDLSKTRPIIQFNKAAKLDETLQAKFDKLSLKPDKNATDLFLEYILTETFRNFHILVETFEELDIIAFGLIENDILPRGALQRHSKMIKFKVLYYNITFACCKTFQDKEVWKVMGDDDRISFFPVQLLSCEHWQAIQELPPFTSFIELQDPVKLRQLKMIFWKSQEGKTWKAEEQLINSSLTRVFALASTFLSYLQSALDFQVSCLQIFGRPQQWKEGQLPFLHPLFSVSENGHVFDTYRLFQELGKFRILKWRDEYPSRVKVSRIETECVEFLRSGPDGDLGWQTEFGTGSQTKLYINGKLAHECDAFHPARREIFSFVGCYWHGCMFDNCPVLGKKNTPALKEKNAQFQRDVEKLMDLCSTHIDNFYYMQECTFRELKKENQDVRKFCRSLRKPMRHFYFRQGSI